MRVLLKIGAGVFIAALFLVVVVPPGLYWLGLNNIRGRPAPPEHTTRNDYDLLQDLKGRRSTTLERLSPWTYPFRVEAETPAVWLVARNYNVDHLAHCNGLWWHLSGAALGIWISRHWSQDQVVAGAAAVLDSGPASNNRRSGRES